MLYSDLEEAVAQENKAAYRLWEVLDQVSKLDCRFLIGARMTTCKRCIVCLAKRYVKEHSERAA